MRNVEIFDPCQQLIQFFGVATITRVALEQLSERFSSELQSVLDFVNRSAMGNLVEVADQLPS